MAYLATAIAFLAAAIAFGQFYTARQKLVLDLFERRLETVMALRAALQSAMAHISEPKLEHMSTFWQAMEGARFLFGPEVITYLEEVSARLSPLRSLGQTPEDHHPVEALYKINVKLDELLLPYMWMQQKIALSLAFGCVRTNHPNPKRPEIGCSQGLPASPGRGPRRRERDMRDAT